MVHKARKTWKIRRIGHAGTLDPMASGVLVLLAGNAARLFDEFQTFPKTYRARLRWGIRTDTQDITGERIDCWTPSRMDTPSVDEIEAALSHFRGEIMQTPPMISALKKDGIPLHKLARQGIVVERRPRPVTVYDLSLCQSEGEESEIQMTVTSGFYVRTLIDDLGVLLGTGAVMTALRRESIGPFSLDICKEGF